MCCLSPNAIKHTINVEVDDGCIWWKVSVLTELYRESISAQICCSPNGKLRHTKGSGVAVANGKVVDQFTQLPWHPWGDCRHLIFQRNVPSLNAVSRTIGTRMWMLTRMRWRHSLDELSHMACNRAMLPHNTQMLAMLPKVRFIYYLRLHKSLQLNITFLERMRKHCRREGTEPTVWLKSKWRNGMAQSARKCLWMNEWFVWVCVFFHFYSS